MENIADYFLNGHLIYVYPSDAHQYDATIFITEQHEYDLLIKEDVLDLPIPNFTKTDSFPEVTKNEDYILRMIASKIRKTDHEYSIIVLRKAVEMMLVSDIGWMHEDYLRLVKWLYQDGYIDEAEKEEKYFDEIIICGHTTKSNDRLKNEVLQKSINNAKELGTDWIFVSAPATRSLNDALYGTRIYSISGKDSRLDRLPIPFPPCNCTFDPVFPFSKLIDWKMRPILDPISYSRRDHIDDRSDEEKEEYRKLKEKQDLPKVFWKEEKQYYYLKYRFPDICPKSKYAFDKLKREDIESFNKLISVLPDLYK